MTIRELEKFAQEFLSKEFGLKLGVPISINGRLTRSLGRFLSYRNRRTGQESATGIELSKALYESRDKKKILDILKHELVHYALLEKGLPNNDGDPYFENTLKRLGVSSTHTYAYSGKVHVYQCDCGKEFKRQARRLPSNRAWHCDCGTVVTSKYWAKEIIV